MKHSSEKQTGFVLLVLLLLFLSFLLGLVYYKVHYEKSFFTYHGFDFTQVPSGYQMKLYINQAQQPSLITLRSDPRDLRDIPVDPTVLSLKETQQIFAIIDPYDNLTGVTTLAVLELDKIIDNPFLFNIPVNASFTRPYGDGQLGVKTCDDAPEGTAVLWFRIEQETKVYSEGGCFIIAGVTEDDLIRGVDKILYALLGVIPL